VIEEEASDVEESEDDGWKRVKAKFKDNAEAH
jgi:hypothetical protein